MRRMAVVSLLFAVLCANLSGMALSEETNKKSAAPELLDLYQVGLIRFENISGDTNLDYLGISVPLLLKEELKKTGDIFVTTNDLLGSKEKIPVNPDSRRITMMSNFRLSGSLDQSNRAFQPAMSTDGVVFTNASLRKRLGFSANILEKNELTFQETAVKHNSHFLFFGEYDKSNKETIVLKVSLYSALQGRTVYVWRKSFDINRVLVDLPKLAAMIRRQVIGMDTVPFRIESKPPGAMVYLDGSYVGLSPVDIPAAAATNHRVLLRKDGYKRLLVDVYLTNRQKTVLRRELQRLPEQGTLTVKTDPPGADIYIDLINRGKTPAVITGLPEGPYRISLEKEGFQTRRIQAVLKDGKKSDLFFRLDKKNPNALPLEKKKERYRIAMNAALYTSAASLLVYAYGNFNYHTQFDVYQQTGASSDADKANKYRSVMDAGFWATIGSLSASTYFLIRYLLIDDKELGMVQPGVSVGTTGQHVIMQIRF